MFDSTHFVQRPGQKVTGLTGAPDRFGNKGNAASFPTTKANMNMMPFWEVSDAVFNFTPFSNAANIGFTISYWINIPDSVSSTIGGINYPFSPTDTKTKIFFGRDQVAGMDLFGMQQIIDRLGIFRYDDITKTRYPWYLWFYDPVSFRNLTGWYHIVWTQYTNWLIIHIFYPDGSEQCVDLYMQIQDFTAISDWGLGNDAGDGSSQTLILDDFKVYNWPLSPAEVNGLDAAERGNVSSKTRPHCNTCGNNAGDFGQGYGRSNWDNLTVSGLVQIYPNPAGDILNINFDLPESDNLHISITDMAGRTFLSKTFPVNIGSQSIMLSNLGLANGTYIISISGKKLSGNYKLVIDR
jgi:hypothetical protein